MLEIAQTLQFASQHHQAGRLREAEQLYRQILVLDPQNSDALNLLGVVATQLGRFDEALSLIRAALTAAPNHPLAPYNLANALFANGQINDAIAAYRDFLKNDPAHVPACANLGAAYMRLARFEEAIPLLQRVIAAMPRLAEAHYNLGVAYREQGNIDMALQAFKDTLALLEKYPDHPDPARLREQASEAEVRSIANKSDFVHVYSMMARLFVTKGMLDEAIAAFRMAITLNPRHYYLYGNLAYNFAYHPGYTAADILNEARQYDKLYAAPMAARYPVFTYDNSPEPNRRIKLGYVSPDFRDHVLSFFTIPLLSHHDKKQFEIVLYSNAVRPDRVTGLIEPLADIYRNTSRLSNDQLIELIRSDKIDILVDITMHMRGNRLPIFARKPAPIQISYLAYPGTTGLSAIDYRFTDPHLDPPGQNDHLYAEKSLHLPDTFWCYDPLTTEPAVNPLPALANGYVTFGCLNNFSKVNDQVLTLWSKLLASLPGSRLILLCPPGDHRKRVLEKLAVDSSRVEFLPMQPRAKYLETYHRIDIALDTFPYNGHTTSLDGLWMGVPAVTLVGTTTFGRAGLCQLTNLQIPELIAFTPDQYLQIATSLAADLPHLAGLRAALRAKMERSPLMDAARFTHAMESHYRRVWQSWCSRNQISS